MKIVPMWVGKQALYHFNDKDRADLYEGENVSLC